MAAAPGHIATLFGVLQYCELPFDITLLLSHVHDLSLDEEHELYRQGRSGFSQLHSDAIELSTIDEALSATERFSGARNHLTDALGKLSQKPEPDKRNAITEAVAAVESAARVVTGEEKATLSDALKVLKAAGQVHPALEQAWLKLYGYTSDEHGLRHAMTKEPNIDFATAKYMVVSCAAFVNLLSART